MLTRRTIATFMAVIATAGCGAAITATTAVSSGTVSASASATPAAHHPEPFTLAHSGIKHVWVIVAENESYDASYLHNPNPWLGRKLQKQGTLLTQYHGIGHVSLDNYIAMISGQAPNYATSSDCQSYTPFNSSKAPATIDKSGQAVGTGCVYPRNVKTLADQLTAHKVSWAGYMDQMGNKKGREQRRCGVPTLDSRGLDDTQRATGKDQYAARHNPFVYFHSLLDSGQCRKHVVPLTRLRAALRHDKRTPRFSFITPDLCDDGHDAPCTGNDAKGSSAGGLVSLDHFLSVWVPRIEHSKAFRSDGLIIITTDESATSDASSCCGEQPGPSDPTPGISGAGGGRTGTLLIGHCVKPNAKDSTPYNHYSLLRSLEVIFGIRRGGSDGKGHLGYAAAKGLSPFGADAFRGCKR
jgi:hypothetical protein